MNFRLKTSSSTGEKILALQTNTGLTWNILARIAIALSLKDPSLPENVTNRGGLEIHRNALTGEMDFVYKTIIKQHSQRNVPEDEYFPDLFNAHLERGMAILDNEYRYAGNFEKLLLSLLEMGGQQDGVSG
ncbi:DNA sulfur modification protein DndE [Sporosarcina ureae]|uniref:DNA sulfur modification protein DndE n=1 Tax=Sporosarcina ureae TaxID=1571 RepID=A0ABM6JVS5_SPOUR|nr:DNA sulfur modification protein DndE [Sporosarcina ureae]ARF14004.1 DNA sulfur modification protein DndE [Sporosarcina ureae]